MVQAIPKSQGTILRLVGAERDARLSALQEAQNERNLRVQCEEKLAEEKAEFVRLKKELESTKTLLAIAETRLVDAVQSIAALRNIKPAEQKQDPAIPRIERALQALLGKETPPLDLSGMTFDIRRDEFGKPKQIVLKEQ
jgi:hypothetical protein